MYIYSPKNRIIIVTGHFGSGKTNVAVNIAMQLARRGEKTTLIDFDVVNPYFRAADSKSELESMGVRCIIPEFANSNVDVPSLPPDIYSVFDGVGYAVFDVGGDETGAVALGMFSAQIKTCGYDMLCVCSMYRPLTPTAEDTAGLLADIEGHSRLRVTGLVNNSNVGYATDADTLAASGEYISRVSALTGVPLLFSATFARGDIDTSELFVMKNVTRDIGIDIPTT
ncbi:MAG: P-loop NTPase [Eubacteriales bacterium]